MIYFSHAYIAIYSQLTAQQSNNIYY